MPRRELSGQVVAITGAAGGLGQALVRAFLRRGARVAALDVNEAAFPELQALGGFTLRCDITRGEACREAVRAILERFGALDVLVNNAGLSHRSLVAATDAAVLRNVMEVNFFGALNATQAALEALAARRGAIVTVSSVAGFAPLVARAGYAASKHALHGLFETLREEVAARGIEVLLACPSFIATGIERVHLGADGGLAQGPRTIVGGELDPDDVAERIVGALERRKRLLLVGRVAWQAYWLSRFAPGLYAGIMARRMRAELQQR